MYIEWFIEYICILEWYTVSGGTVLGGTIVYKEGLAEAPFCWCFDYLAASLRERTIIAWLIG